LVSQSSLGSNLHSNFFQRLLKSFRHGICSVQLHDFYTLYEYIGQVLFLITFCPSGNKQSIIGGLAQTAGLRPVDDREMNRAGPSSRRANH
jgi:hypothetical protein